MGPQQTIGHYRIGAKLGEGGMGAVYRATDTKLNRDVAIKVIPDAFAGDPDRRHLQSGRSRHRAGTGGRATYRRRTSRSS
jgi:serine/threonine protein kinase